MFEMLIRGTLSLRECGAVVLAEGVAAERPVLLASVFFEAVDDGVALFPDLDPSLRTWEVVAVPVPAATPDHGADCTDACALLLSGVTDGAAAGAVKGSCAIRGCLFLFSC